MLRKLALTLAASVALGAAALSPTAASAGWKGGWGWGHHGCSIGWSHWLSVHHFLIINFIMNLMKSQPIYVGY